MTTDFQQVFDHLAAWASAHGIRVGRRAMSPRNVGEFDGVSITMNADFDPESCAYYFAHALGSIVRWCLNRPQVQAMFDELRDAKKSRDTDRERLERAIARYREFEVESSDFAVWILAQIGDADVTASYTNFLRADLEALVEFHRTRKAPVWRDFFARWNAAVARGEQAVAPFTPKPVPPFEPTRTEKQEILQEQGPA